MVPPMDHGHFFKLMSLFSFANNTSIHGTYFDTRLLATTACTRGADKSLARPCKETNYSDQYLQHYSKAYGVQTTI